MPSNRKSYALTQFTDSPTIGPTMLMLQHQGQLRWYHLWRAAVSRFIRKWLRKLRIDKDALSGFTWPT